MFSFVTRFVVLPTVTYVSEVIMIFFS